MLLCPVCKMPLQILGKTAQCENGHRFDMAKEGYVNLLLSSKSGDKMGDDKYSARCRRDFLNKGYYKLLQDGLSEIFRQAKGAVLDICCGEGYYTSALGENPNLKLYGFDISKEMVRLAAKRGNATFFVANMASIPVADNSFDYAIHLFAPFHEKEFFRILKPGGSLFSVVPGKMHLFGLKEVLYDTPYVNDEKLPFTERLTLIKTHKLTERICLTCPEDIDAVFRMTPYYFHTSIKDKEKINGLRILETDIDFLIGEYKKNEDS